MGGAVSSGKDNNELIDNLMSGNYIRSREVERVFRALDRAEYMTPEARDQAYKDLAWRNGPLHLSSPCIYSEVMEGLELRPGLSFLNIGAGTGYLSTLVGLILGSSGISHGVEVHPAVVEYATKKLNMLFENSPVLDDFDFCEPKFYQGNGLCLSQLQSGYDRVYCGAGCPEQYENYFKKLIKVGGILVMPLNDTLLQVRRVAVDKWTSKSLLSVSFATLRIPTAKEATDQIKLDKQAPVRLQLLARAVVREAMRRGVLCRRPELREKPRPPPPAACPRRICIPIESGDSVEGLNVLHDLDNENGANEMNALLSLVISMGQSRVAGALRFDRISSSDDEVDDNRDQDNHNQDEDNSNHQQDNDNQQQDGHNHQQDSHNHQQNNHSLGQDNHNHNQDNHNSDQDNHNQNLAKNNSQNSQPEQSSSDNPEPSTRRKHLSDSESDRMLYSDAYVHSLMQNIDPEYLSETSDYELAMPGVLRKKTDKPDEPSFIVPSGDKTNTVIETNVGTPNTSASGSNEANKSLDTNARPSEPGNIGTPISEVSSSHRPRANSTDERSPVSRKSGRDRWTRMSTSSEKCKRTPNLTETEEVTDVAASKNPSASPRSDLPGTPSEVETELGKVTQSDASVPMEWEETSVDNPEGSEDETEPSKSKPKRQKLDSGIGESTPTDSSPEKSKNENSDDDSRHSDCISENAEGSNNGESTPTGSSPEKSKNENSDDDSRHSDCISEDAEGSFDGSAADEDGSSFVDHNYYDSDLDSPIDYNEEDYEDSERSGSWSPSREEREESVLQRIARLDGRRFRLSCLMKNAVNELPLPHALKRFVNLGRCLEV